MTQEYKVGDRVRLVTDGGYKVPEFFPGALGTVVWRYGDGVDVCVDGYPDDLYFFADEIEPYEADQKADPDVQALLRGLVSLGDAMATRLTHVVGKEDIVVRWEKTLAEYRKATKGE